MSTLKLGNNRSFFNLKRFLQMGPPKRNEDMGLLPDLRVSLVFGGSLSEKTEVP